MKYKLECKERGQKEFKIIARFLDQGTAIDCANHLWNSKPNGWYYKVVNDRREILKLSSH